MTVKELALVREAILDTIDKGDPERACAPHCDIHATPWDFYSNESEADSQRLDFCDAVQSRILELSKEQTNGK